MVVLAPAVSIPVLADTNLRVTVPVDLAALVHRISALDLGDLRLLLMVVLAPAVSIPVLADTNSPVVVRVGLGGLNGITAVLNSLVRAEGPGRHGVAAGFHLMAHQLGTLIRIPMERSPRMKSCNCLPKLTSMVMAR